MTLGQYLRQARKGRSIRWISQRSRELHPDNPRRQVSNSYYSQLENDRIGEPSPSKLRTIADVLQLDVRFLYRLVGYLEEELLPQSPDDFLRMYISTRIHYQLTEQQFQSVQQVIDAFLEFGFK